MKAAVASGYGAAHAQASLPTVAMVAAFISEHCDDIQLVVAGLQYIAATQEADPDTVTPEVAQHVQMFAAAA